MTSHSISLGPSADCQSARDALEIFSHFHKFKVVGVDDFTDCGKLAEADLEDELAARIEKATAIPEQAPVKVEAVVPSE